MLLVAGLGNPGAEYANNRHNIGFMAVDEVVRRHGFSPFRSKFQGELAERNLGGEKVLILKPMTFMNESGRSVLAAMSFYQIAPEDVLIIHDEIDLAGGKVRIKRGGGHAGHNGLRSIHSHIGPNYGRVRLGVGHPGEKGKVAGHVLKDFAKADHVWLDPLIDGFGEHFPKLVDGDDGHFMTKIAEAINPPRPNAPQSSPDDVSGAAKKADK
ncbi:MAG: aminoacyl-tRNA hydrolase [Rhodospirillaceae bacterium]|nr:aminoacyl-tRNA hydrolase [Rhodospirillaceae bacterium]